MEKDIGQKGGSAYTHIGYLGTERDQKKGIRERGMAKKGGLGAAHGHTGHVWEYTLRAAR